MAKSKINLKNADRIRNGKVISLEKEIRTMYNDLAKKIGQRADAARGSETWSKQRQAAYLQDLQRLVEKESLRISLRLQTGLSETMFEASMAVIEAERDFMKKVGIKSTTAFAQVPREVVRAIKSGKIYESGWNLSQRIWGMRQETLKKIYGIVAEGVASQSSTRQIAKNLEMYVKPAARIDAKVIKWIDPNGTVQRYYPGKVDYNANRLARTLTQHAYQQTIQVTSKANPWVTMIQWNSTGSRTCPICASRDGELFKPDQLPQDHPNGMCTFEPQLDKSFDQISSEVADWYNSPEGTYPSIDAYSKYF